MATVTEIVKEVVEWAVDTVVNKRGDEITSRMDRIKKENPSLTNKEIAFKLVGQRAIYAGIAGGVTSLGGLITLPLSIPASFASTLLIQAEMMLCISHLNGLNIHHEDRKRDFLILMAGSSIGEVLKTLGVEAGKRLTAKAADKIFTREVMKKIWKIFGRKTITKAGTKSTFS